MLKGVNEMRISNLSIDRVYINSVRRTAGYRMSENHFHYYYELYYVRKGHCQLFVGSSLFDLSSGDCVLIPMGDNHIIRYLTDCTRVNLYFTKNDEADSLDVISSRTRADFTIPHFFHIPYRYLGNVDMIIDDMLKEEKVDDSLTPQMQAANLKRLFIMILRYADFDDDRMVQDLKTKDSSIIGAARYIASNYQNPITLEQVATVAGLSPTYFSKKFHMVTGMRVKEYICYHRLKNAAMELVSTKHSITQIALNNGFSDSNYFKDAFRKMYGCSPRDYRANQITDHHLLEQSQLARKHV